MVKVPRIGGDTIKRKPTYASMFALCVIFSALPFAGAAEVQNTDINQNISQATSGTNTVTDEGLKIGAEGKYVVELQKWLKNQGYYTGATDGSFGPYTKQAVKYFQNDSNIVVDGWVANQTINAMEELTDEDLFTESNISTDSSTSSSNVKSTKKPKNSASNITSDSTSKKSSNSNVSTTKKTKASTSSKSKSVSTTRISSLSQILASGAKYGYSHSASTAAGMVAIGSGDCWAMSDYLYSKLQAAGIESRIVQYSTAYSARHRSVQLYQNGAWVDVPYSSYGYSTMFKATSSKPGLTVIAS